MFKIFSKYIPVFIFALFIFSACSEKEKTEEDVVARVDDKKLLLSDLAKIVPDNMSLQDSAVIADDYINKWIKHELLIQKANENLSPEQKDVSRELEEYRNSLIIFKYKNELIKQRMDTTVTDKEIEDFYNSHNNAFKLNKNIVKAVFVKVPNEVANPSLLKSLTSDLSDEGLTELKEYALQYAKSFDFFLDKWVNFETVIDNIPENIDDAGNFLTHNKLIEIKDSDYYYLVRIDDYKLKSEPAPLDYVKSDIKKLLLNQRKIKFLKDIENNIYAEGIRKNKFKIYRKKATDEVNKQ